MVHDPDGVGAGVNHMFSRQRAGRIGAEAALLKILISAAPAKPPDVSGLLRILEDANRYSEVPHPQQRRPVSDLIRLFAAGSKWDHVPAAARDMTGLPRFGRPLRVGAGFVLALSLFLVGPTAAQTPHHAEPAAFSCQGDQKVWLKTRSGVYHLRGKRYYGSTKQGKYECKKVADVRDHRETRNGQ